MTMNAKGLTQADVLSGKLDALLGLIQNSPKLKDAGYIAPDSELDHPETKSFGDFLTAIQRGNKRRLFDVYKSRYEEDEDEMLPKHIKAALAEGAGATGGYGVPTEYGELLLNKSKGFNALRMAGATQVTMNKNSKQYPTLDIETAPSAGDTPYAGGSIAYWVEEAQSITESEPRFRLVELIAHKLASYSIASNEIRDDFGSDLDSLMMDVFAKAIGSREEYAFFRGNGVGRPLGILASAALISATRDNASQIGFPDLAQMISDLTPDSYQKAAWFVSVGSLDQIVQLVTNPLAFLKSFREGWQSGTLLGFPLHVVTCLPALNTAGDILLVDPSYYLIGDYAGGVKIAFSEHFKFQTDQVAWRVTKRVDGQPLVANNIYGEDGASTFSPFVALAAK